MITFINCGLFNKVTSNEKPILINWQQIMLVEPNDDDTTITLTMLNGKTIPITSDFDNFRKLLLEYELTLDERHRVISFASEDHDWEMIDRD